MRGYTAYTIRLLALSLLILLSWQMRSYADCTQLRKAIFVHKHAHYILRVNYIDNRVQAVIQNSKGVQTVYFNVTGNGPYNLIPSHGIEEYLTRGENLLIISGYNEAYHYDRHDPNPGQVSYTITENRRPIFPVRNCFDGDWRGFHERQFFGHTYSLFVAR